MEDCEKTLSTLSRLARLELQPEDCEAIESIREFFSTLSEAKRLVEGKQPLYHVWETESHLRIQEAYHQVNIKDLMVEVEEGFVKFPWRGKQ
ncbi:MAG: hypothetical protein F7C82_05600 [Desulfurococcales archaeon]|nr:hypothetical protein [Desulfurococcales archaeon]MCE4626908.1 hypothetical protein [Desulfurococcales archaeon]MCE4629735.1 hypothetical protein [Desulfurococcales archaeon]